MQKSILTSIPLIPPFYIGKVLFTSSNKPFSKVNIKNNINRYGAIELSPGRFLYKSLFAEILELLQNHAKFIAKKLKFELVFLPKIVPKEILHKFGIIDVWPAYVLDISPMKNFDDGFYTTITENNDFCLDPVQCAPFYEYLMKKNDISSEPIKLLDISGYSYRNEFQKRLNSTIKSLEFLRAEFVFAGKEIVGSTRNDLLNEYLHLFKRLNLQWRLTIGSGCYEFPSEEELKAYERANSIETIPIIDVEIFSPSFNDWIEVIGASNLFDEKIKRFNIYKDGNAFESGCVGVGLSRLSGLLIEAYGEDTSKILEEIIYER